MDDTSRLVVIIPCRDVEGTLGEQLDALARERWSEPWSVVVVDNGSTDRTADLAAEREWVTVVGARDRAGVAYARNVGIQHTTAERILICDGDDVIEPGFVAAMADALDGADLVGARVDPTRLNPGGSGTVRPVSTGPLPSFGALPFVPGGALGMRRTVTERIGSFDEEFDGLEDVEFSLRAHAADLSIAGAPGAVIAYRFRGDLRAIWRQGRFYGRGRPLLVRRARELGLPAPSRVGGLRSWAWLVLHPHLLASSVGRRRLLWVVAFRTGVLSRAIELRELHV